MAKDAPDLVARESLMWHRYGPVWYRIRKLVLVALNLGGIYLVLIVVATLLSLYQGAGKIGAKGPPERPVRATVQHCHRVGPLSGHGLGFWWICDIVVRANGRADTQGVVTRSIATPDQVGHSMELRERCFGEQDTDCGYGKPTSPWWGLYLGLLQIARFGLVALLAINIVFDVLVAIFGAPRYVRFVERREQRKRKAR